MEKISLRAPAKINLYLLVLAKRSDGFHEIESLMQAVDLYDEITLENADRIELKCNYPKLPIDETNLAFRAARAMQSRFAFPGVKINLIKNIPIGSGLGGGSSDAASVIRGLCRLYNINPSSVGITEIASSLGSDVPFFLGTGQALARGRGELLEPMELPLTYEIAIISPGLSISTAEIYNNAKIDLTTKRNGPLMQMGISFSGFLRLVSEFRNDLEEVALARYPQLIELKQTLLGSGAFYSSITGSGSSFFGLFESGTEKSGTLEDLSERGIKVFRCRPITLTPLA